MFVPGVDDDGARLANRRLFVNELNSALEMGRDLFGCGNRGEDKTDERGEYEYTLASNF